MGFGFLLKCEAPNLVLKLITADMQMYFVIARELRLR